MVAGKMMWLPKLLYYLKFLTVTVPGHILRSLKR